jgi:hypothetical protein
LLIEAELDTGNMVLLADLVECGLNVSAGYQRACDHDRGARVDRVAPPRRHIENHRADVPEDLSS